MPEFLKHSIKGEHVCWIQLSILFTPITYKKILRSLLFRKMAKIKTLKLTLVYSTF